MHHGLTAPEKEKLKALHDYMLANLQQQYTMQWICAYSGLSRYRLNHFFKRQYKSRIFQWLHIQRMERARQLVLESDKPLKEIASLAGYRYSTNFFLAYKQYYGHTPGADRDPEF